MKWLHDKETRAWLGALLYVIIVCMLIAFLTWAHIPPGNRDIVVALVGVLAGAVAPAVARLVGRRTIDD